MNRKEYRHAVKELIEPYTIQAFTKAAELTEERGGVREGYKKLAYTTEHCLWKLLYTVCFLSVVFLF